MQPSIFTQFREIIYRESGIVLSEAKSSLLSARIQKRLRALNLQSESEYLNVIETDLSGQELLELIDAISTNVTYFYREESHFQFLAEIFKQYRAQKRSTVKLWCAAASSGQEPYTIAIEAARNLDLRTTEFKMLATDICTKVLRQATQAIYTAEEIKTVPPEIRDSFFQSTQINGRQRWKVSEQLTNLITFKRLNLVEYPYPLRGPTDIIFCRNVMIYFDTETRQKIIDQFSRILAPDGYLFISHSESLLGIRHSFSKVGNSVFQKQTPGVD